MRRLTLMFITLLPLSLIGQDTASMPVPEIQKFHLQAIDAKLDRAKIARQNLQLQFDMLGQEIESLTGERDRVVQEAYTAAKVKPADFTINAAGDTFTKIVKAPAKPDGDE